MAEVAFEVGIDDARAYFEIAIATAVNLYGLGSQAALGTTMGLFWEVPVMLGLAFVSKKLRDRGFWKTETPMEWLSP
jgi:ACR3 family arsenite transporter